MTADSQTSANSGQWTIRKVLEWTTAHLKKHGSATPRLDAEVLLAHARQCHRIQLYTHYDEELTEEVRASMRDLVQRRARQEPVAYLVGEREFFSLPFHVNADVLIPRPDSETLIVEAISCLKPTPADDTASVASRAWRIVDLCTGSGCLAITLARQLPTSQLIATDLSDKALAVARQNLARHSLADRVELRQGSLLQPLQNEPPFDLIISNPPYIPSSDIETLEEDVRRHEPRLALDGGADGMDLLRPLITEGPKHLLPGGWMLLEFTSEQAPALMNCAQAQPDWSLVQVVKDLSQLPRVLKLQKRS